MEHLADTKRLRIFFERIKPTPHNMKRHVFLAFRRDEDRPMVCGTMVAWDGMIPTTGKWFIDWIEIASEYRRKGFAREMTEGIAKAMGGVWESSGATPEGEAYCAAMELDTEEGYSAGRGAVRS